MAEEVNKVIYSMYRVGRLYPPNKQVLRDITLGFYYGAKIGVLGLNGAGKSTLLKIMAGIDEGYIGEISKSKGFTVGYLEQEQKHLYALPYGPFLLLSALVLLFI